MPRLGASGGTVNLRLKADSRFEWSMIYGVSDRFAEGQWHEANGKVVFTSDPITPFNWFKVTGQTQYADRPDTGQPLSLLVDVGESQLSNSIQTVVQASADDVQRLSLQPTLKASSR